MRCASSAAALVAAIVIGMACACADPPIAAPVDFARAGIDVPPSDFDLLQTGNGPPGRWIVVRDHSARNGAAIEQSSTDATENRYPLAIYTPASVKNVAVSVCIKIVGGQAQTAGVALRLVNVANYDLITLNTLEGRVDLYTVIDGTRQRITGTDAELRRDRWHALSVAMEGDHVTVGLDGELLFKAWDRHFLNDGRVALWTEEDTLARFDRIQITPQSWSEDN